MMKIFGTTTSPFVRRVRIVAAELGVGFDLVNTATEEGQAALRQVTPIWKVPTAVVDDVTLFDSRVIIDYLIERHGWGPLRAPDGSDEKDRWRQQNLRNVIDGALDSGINLFYFERDGIDLTATSYFQRQQGRIRSALAWLEGELRGAHFTEGGPLGLAEIALVSALDWFTFRKRYDVDAHPGLVAFRNAHAHRDSIQSTYPAA